MGIGYHEFAFLLHEHKHKPISGQVLTIGKQAISINPEQIKQLLLEYGVPLKTSSFEFDDVNQHNHSGAPSVADHSLFASFTDCKLLSADISGYEGADFIFDICGEVPSELHGRFDFVIDGGTLDNVFDPVKMVSNMTKMLKPGGRLFAFVWGNTFPTAYLKVSPDWLMDYCSVNQFADAKTYVLEYPFLSAPVRSLFPWKNRSYRLTMWHYDPYVEYSGQIGYECSSLTTGNPFLVYLIAEKDIETSFDKTAVQKHYRGDGVEPYLTSMKKFRKSSRPIFNSPSSLELDSLVGISSYPTVRPVASWKM